MKKHEIEYKKKLLTYKKSKFLNAVRNSSKYLGFIMPQVVFWNIKYINHFEKNERAHIHLESNTICIPETELEIMNEEEINETASHEVSHLRDASHETSFHNIQNKTEASLWKPPSGKGVIFMDGNQDVSSETEGDKSKKEKINKKECNYHLC